LVHVRANLQAREKYKHLEKLQCDEMFSAAMLECRK